MLKKLFRAGILACLCSTAHAATTWNFTYTGFLDSSDGQFHAERLLTGSFSGTDANADGIFHRSEITSLVLNGHDFIACQPASNEFYTCSTDVFSYSAAGGLYFKAGEYGRDPEGWVSAGHYFVVGDGEYRYNRTPGHEENHSYRWTPLTTFTISPAPEPATWAMLATGLLLTALATRRRRAQPRPAVLHHA